MNKDIVYQPFFRARLDKPFVCLFTTALLAFPLAAQAASPPETLEAKQGMAFSAYDAVHWQTPITTYNGNVYFAWVDKQLRTMIAKETPDGKVTTNVILSKSDADHNHSLPSLAVDKHGYIHVAYNMHQSRWKEGDTRWQYKVSDRPEDISAFTYVGDTERTIPGHFITYPSFVKDNNGELYVSFRHRTPGDGQLQVVGSQGLAIAKYDVSSKRWSMLGGTSYPRGEKTFFWSNSTRQKQGKGPGYHGYRAKIFFDRNNRMHISWDVFIEPGDWTSHIMYAYSDDGGNTFKKANGQTISPLPITPQNGDVVEAAPRGIYWTRTYVGVTKDGRPIVSFEDVGSNSYYKVWNGDSWGTKKELPASRPALFFTDANGVMTAVDDGKFSRSWDEGETWKSYQMDMSSESTALDVEYLKQSGALRFQTQVGDTIKVLTARFSTGDDSSRPSPPTGLSVEVPTNQR